MHQIISNVDHVDLSYRIGNVHGMKMQSKTNSIIHANVEKDKSEIKTFEDPNSVHPYEVFKPLPVKQNECISEDMK